MSVQTNVAVRVVRAPRGLPRIDDFRLDEVPMPRLGTGEVLFRVRSLSVDPAVRRRLPSSVSAPGPLGAVAAEGSVVLGAMAPAVTGLDGDAIGEVVDSRDPSFVPGDFVRRGDSWQLFQTAHASTLDRLTKVDGIPLEYELGVLGQSGFVAWCGVRIGAPQPGEVVVVSAAGGAVGMVAGQIARLSGARVIGISSGEKCRYVVEELGFDTCLDRNAGTIPQALDAACPNGVDVYFENVGGVVGRAVFDRMRDFGRVVVCGMVGEYNGVEADSGPPLRPVLRRRLRVQGFVFSDHVADYPEYRTWAMSHLRSGRLRYRIDVTQGLANAPAALIRLLEGQNYGKSIVSVAI